MKRPDKTAFQRGKLEVLEHFFQRYGIGVLNVHNRPYARLKWGSSRKYMLPAFPLKRSIPEDHEEQYDLNSIRSLVSNRLYPNKDVFSGSID